MHTVKLTLSIPNRLVAQAKDYSRRSRQSLSSLVSRYFSVLSRRGAVERNEERVAAKVKRVTGLARSGRGEADLLFETLSQKYRLK